MAMPADTAQDIRAALEPYVRPREEAAYIRRVLRAHMAASLRSDDDSNDGSSMMDGSLALISLSWDTKMMPEARGLQKAYLQALQTNIDAQRAFDQRSAAVLKSSTPASSTNFEEMQQRSANGADILQDHLAMVKLRRKKDRLQVVNRYLDALSERPVAVAAGEDFLLAEFVYGDATLTLPPIPKAVVDGLAEDAALAATSMTTSTSTAASKGTTSKTATADNLKESLARLEKLVLRAQLVLRQEEMRLAAAKAQLARMETRSPTAAAKLRALGVVRNELVAWMEMELSNAGSEEAEDEDTAESWQELKQSLLNGHELAGSCAFGSSQKTGQLRNKLDEIHEKYSDYVDARRALVAMVERMTASGERGGKTAAKSPSANVPQLLRNNIDRVSAATASSTALPEETETIASTANESRKAVARGRLLLMPYLERLMAVARDQKADISHKAHYNGLLTKRLKETCQTLDHLADESQLLPRFGSPKTGGDGDAGAGGGGVALLRKKGIFAPAKGTTTPDGAGQRVIAWTEAAESAKIAVFETVFEKVEEGQVALEEAADFLAEAESMLGTKPEDGEVEGTSNLKQAGDIWSALNGELSLVRAKSRRQTVEAYR
ncbi:hypothetical protein SEPCBS119000_001863 [Sporothrix epigloea]|uniref:Autophagy-related protein 11 n=1 Tax=Sporothrix epigloea TaxID=1892477 RepID=A0ABP0DEQ3_9PEZI